MANQGLWSRPKRKEVMALPYRVRSSHITPQSKQVKQLCQSLVPELGAYGSYQSGKSNACLHKLYMLHCQHPNFQSLILRNEKTDVVKTVIPKWENEILPIHPQHSKSPIRVHGKNSPIWYDWPNGGRTWIDGCNNPKDFETGAWDFIYICQGEELPLDTYEILCARANGRAGNWIVDGKRIGQVLIDMNPDRRDHWTEERIANGQMKKIQFTFEDNPTLYYDGEYTEFGEQVIDDLRKTLTGHRYTRYYLGQAANAEGVVFDQFDYDQHVIDKLPQGIETWPCFRSIDFGMDHPFVCQWWAKDPKSKLRICVKEYRWSNRIVEDHAVEVKRLSCGYNVRATWADHDTEDAATLRRHGIQSMPAIKSDKLRNIDVVASLLTKGQILFYKDALDKVDPRLKSKGYPRDLISEIEGWQWKENSTKDEPMKKFDDSIDSMLYANAGLNKPLGSAHPGTIAKRNLI